MRLVLSFQRLFVSYLLSVGQRAVVSDPVGQWTQVGDDIDGENAWDFAGGTQQALAMNPLGTTIAVGSSGHDGGGTDAGHVRVFNLMDGRWEQRGADISGERAKDASGTSVVLSDDGMVIGIGEPNSEAGNTDQFERDFGQVRVFAWSEKDGDWVQRGNAITGVDRFDFATSGQGLAMDASGSTIVVGAAPHDGKGHARVFDWDGTDWSQRGDDMDGEAAGDWFGHAVAMSASGNTVAVGALFNDGNAENVGCVVCKGSVRIFDWNADDAVWTQRGADVDGEEDHDFSGSSVALNGAGDVVAIGSPQENAPYGHPERGAVTVYEWDGSDWMKRGDRIEGEADGDISGSAVVISSLGDVIAIGAYLNDGISDTEGHVRVFDWDGSDWSQRGDDIDGESKYDYSGYSLAMSADGDRLASGARYTSEGGGEFAGHVRVFDWQESESVNPTTSPVPSSVPSMKPSEFSMETCDDGTDWKFEGDSGKDCGWVFKKSNRRCGLEDGNGVTAIEACPLACKSTSNCEIPDCLENSQWQPNDESFDNCRSLKGLNRKAKKAACSKIGTDEVTFGYEACKKCKKCQK